MGEEAMTSANVVIYVIRKDGKIVGEHSQHYYCKTKWERLLQFQPLAEHTIQWTWLDEDEAPHTKDPEPLVDFLERIVKEEEGLERRFPARKTKREAEGRPSPRQRYLGGIRVTTIEKAAIQHNGRVYTGRRHCLIGQQMLREGACRRPYPGGDAQGFITSDGRFVGRLEARQIALKAGQGRLPANKDELFSEDLWEVDGTPK
jgi:hypothetical protein